MLNITHLLPAFNGLKNRARQASLLNMHNKPGSSQAPCALNAELTFDHVQQCNGCWVIVDLVGKRNQIRTVPILSWAKAAINVWTEVASIVEGRILCSIHKGGYVSGDRMADQAIADIVRLYAAECGFEIAAYDLQRTVAELAHKGALAWTRFT
jgi:integrase